MHIHILGICGTFMSGIALLAKQSGYQVSGCDANVYPPISTQLAEQDIKLIEGYTTDQINLHPDIYVIGNVVSRGNLLMEEILNRGLPYISGPEWLSKNILHIEQAKWVLAVAGTHGKTTTTSILTWILEYAGLNPGFLIGGIPQNFGISARLPLNDSSFFVIEADEYDTAFFDKRAKFIHYHPRTLILNNLEFDHADIYENLTAIETQFHHLIRTVPAQGLIIANAQQESLKRVLAKGVWTATSFFNDSEEWQVQKTDDSSFTIFHQGKQQGAGSWDVLGKHNRQNALSAVLAARHIGVPIDVSLKAMSSFQNVKRRLEKKGEVGGIEVYDDFAHHPTAIAETLKALREKIGARRLIAVLELRSNTMKSGSLKKQLADSLIQADQIFCYIAPNIDWNVSEVITKIQHKFFAHKSIETLQEAIRQNVKKEDVILVMSNGGFGGIQQKLLDSFANT